MKNGTEIKKKLREIVDANSNLPIQAEVTKVEAETCAVKLASGLELEDVRLKSAINESEDFLLVRPKVGSKVLLISVTGDLTDLAILKIDQVKNIEMKQNGLHILADGEDGKVKIENSAVGLKEIFEDLSSILKSFKVFTPSGPSGTPLPPVIHKIVAFEMKFKQLLK